MYIALRSTGRILFSFEGESLVGADLSDSYLPGADLAGRDLRRVRLFLSRMAGADFTAADLRDAHLAWTNLQGARLVRADLRQADMRGADLRGADLREAMLEGARLQWAQYDAGTRVSAGTDLGLAEFVSGKRPPSMTTRRPWPPSTWAVNRATALLSREENAR